MQESAHLAPARLRARPATRNDGLDAVRLGAALSVFAAHALLATGSLTDYRLGDVGVAIFFVLSGYLVAKVWADRPSRAYWVQRAARIVPAYWLAVVGCAVLVGAPLTAASFLTLQPIDVAEFDTFLGVAWTLRVELVFYAIVPLLARFPWAVIVGLAAASFAAFYSSGDDDFRAIFPLRFWEFLPGLLLARRAPRVVHPAYALGGLAMLGSAIVAPWQIALPTAVVGAGIVVAYALANPIRMPRPVVFGAAISYAVYLWHRDVLRAARDAGLSTFGIVGVGVGATLVIATLSWLLLERPVMRFASARLRRRQDQLGFVAIGGGDLAYPVGTYAGPIVSAVGPDPSAGARLGDPEEIQATD